MSFSEDKTGNDGPRRRSLARYDGSTPIPPPNCLAAHGQDLPPLPQELPVADTPRCSISSDFSVNSLASLVVRDTSIGQFDGVNRMDENLHTPTNCTKETRKQSNIPIFRIDHRATTGLMGFVQMADSQEKPKIDKHKRKKRKAKSRRGVVRVDAANSCYTEQDEFGFNIYVRLEDNLRNTFMQFGEAEIGNVAPIQDEQCGMLAKVSEHQGISTGAEMVLKFTCLQKSTQSWNRTRVNSGYAIAPKTEAVKAIEPKKIKLLKKAYLGKEIEVLKGPSNTINWYLQVSWRNPKPGTPKPRITVDIRDGEEIQSKGTKRKDPQPTIRLNNLSKGKHKDEDFDVQLIDQKFIRRDSYEENECELFGEEVARGCNKIGNLYQKRLLIWSIRELIHEARFQQNTLVSSDEESHAG